MHKSHMTASEFEERREALGLSRSELAAALLVTPRLIQLIEAGQRNVTERMKRDLERLASDMARETV